MEYIILGLGFVFGGWLLSLVLGIKLGNSRRELRSLEQEIDRILSQRDAQDGIAEEDHKLPAKRYHDQFLLRLELKRLLEEGKIDNESYLQATDGIDELVATDLNLRSTEEAFPFRKQRLDQAWQLLVTHGKIPNNPPPWADQAEDTIEAVEAIEAVKFEPEEESPTPEITRQAAPDEIPIIQDVDTEYSNPLPAQIYSRQSIPKLLKETSSLIFKSDDKPEEQVVEKPAKTQSETIVEHALKPVEPDRMEKAIKSISGLPRLLLPFLVQNIGWFVGVFCFLSGSIFLVTYTTGFTKAVLVLAAIYIYTMFMIWAGYQIRKKRPNAVTASNALLLMGLLLVPLGFSAAARLILGADGNVFYTIVALAIAGIVIVTFYIASQMVSGILDRTLQGNFSRLFLLLSSVQLGAPLLNYWPHYYLLFGMHLVLLGLLSYGFISYTQDWMKSIFIDKRKLAYFAGGSLLYACLVSYVHLTFGTVTFILHDGYYAPFLMLICSLLFYIDAAFKKYAHEHAFLSRFTFLIYGLSVIAVLMTTGSPGARLLTLVIAAIMYASVAWRYLTLVPLYLLLACLCGLYHQVVLLHITYDWYFHLTLPGLLLVKVVDTWLARKQAGREKLSLLRLNLYRFSVVASVLVLCWSLVFSQPGWLAMSSSLLLGGYLWWIFTACPGNFIGAPVGTIGPGTTTDIRNSQWLYLVILSVVAALAFMPIHAGYKWPVQFAFTLVILACVWTGLFLLVKKTEGHKRQVQLEILVNSAIVCLIVSLMLTGPSFDRHTITSGFVAISFLISSSVLLTLSMSLYLQWLFYGTLITAGITGALIKMIYFPGQSAGLTEMLMVFGLCCYLWWLDRHPDELSILKQQQAEQLDLENILWIIPVRYQGPEMEKENRFMTGEQSHV